METLTEKFNQSLKEKEREQFEKYYKLLIEWNEKFNLTTITEREEVYKKHFADSTAALDLVRGRLMDIGAGAGFPSLPLKIMKPSLDVTMADSLNKRVGFLEEVIKSLNLESVRAIHTRAEDIKEKESYDCVVARAVAPLDTLVEYMLPFVSIGGIAVAYKSGNVEEELKRAETAIRKLGGGRVKVEKFNLDEETERTLVIIKKLKNTPNCFPRSGNKPRKDPIR